MALVRYADHSDEADSGVGKKHFLYFAWVHVEPSAHDHVLGTIDDVVIAVRLAAADVAGAEPAVADGDFPGLAIGHVVPLVVDQPDAMKGSMRTSAGTVTGSPVDC
jgi:hypothetical protein